jgi:hypothetical protein
MPLPDEVVGRGGEQPCVIDRFAPIRSADLLDGLPLRKVTEVPGGAETGEEIDPVSQGRKILRDFRIGI